ncbi:MAG: hypothetical protein SGI83_16780 [Bacteroidota bacterium]|nr:hypothetical protein [Bacteroidota bacterium]
MSEKVNPIFNKRIFWDVVFENINYNSKANFVLERVFERGMWMTSAIAAGITVMKKLLKHY